MPFRVRCAPCSCRFGRRRSGLFSAGLSTADSHCMVGTGVATHRRRQRPLDRTAPSASLCRFLVREILIRGRKLMGITVITAVAELRRMHVGGSVNGRSTADNRASEHSNNGLRGRWATSLRDRACRPRHCSVGSQWGLERPNSDCN
jgi:hypothetical protein